MRSRSEVLVSSLAEYGAYHTHPGNKVVHVLFVPLLLWSAFAALSVFGAATAFGLWSLYTLLFIYLEPVAGVVSAVLYYALLLHAQTFAATSAAPLATAAGVHVLSWVLQVGLGHHVFEKRKPALLDSLLPSLALAPFFVCLEVRPLPATALCL